MMPKRPHPADAFNAGIVAAAIEWTAHMPAGERPTERFTDRSAAEAAAQRLAARFRRPALVYAVNAAGRSALAATISPIKETAMPKTTKPAAARTEKAPATEKAPKSAKAAKPASGRRAASARAAAVAQTVPEKPALAAAVAKPTSKRAAALEAAQRGEMPAAPDFSAPTHARFRKKLAEVVALAEAGDIEGLRAFQINPVSTSPKAIDRFRALSIEALQHHSCARK